MTDTQTLSMITKLIGEVAFPALFSVILVVMLFSTLNRLRDVVGDTNTTLRQQNERIIRQNDRILAVLTRQTEVLDRQTSLLSFLAGSLGVNLPPMNDPPPYKEPPDE